MNNLKLINQDKTSSFGIPFSVFRFRSLMCSLVFLLGSFFSFSQVSSSIDSTSITMGRQITYEIAVQMDSTQLVVFPEGQTFSPLEMIESYVIDTIKNKDKFNLIKRYGLTQFDSGVYTIPQQKIIIGNKTYLTDSLKVEVRELVIDTTKLELYDIKPIMAVEKSSSSSWLYILLVLLIIAVLAFLLYWFIWRKKPLTEAEQIALLPPYDRAKLALKKLDESHYLEHSEIKEYYSELTLIIRKYLDEKVYDHALESTTDELIGRLNLLKAGNQIDLSPGTIKNIESILKRADLVKFAKSAPDVALAELDRSTVDAEIDHVKEVLPEPTKEERLLDEKYKAEQARKKKRKKIIITVVISIFLLMATFVGLSVKYGFNIVKDTIIGHESKELLESKWVTSQYGVPPITISTPKVLKRMDPQIPEEMKEKISVTMFNYGSLIDNFNVVVTTTKILGNEETKIEPSQIIEESIKMLESSGVQNIVVKNEEFVTPNGAEGIKAFGTADFPSKVPDKIQKGNYVILAFNAENVIQQVMLTWKEHDTYAEQMIGRIVNSVELKNLEE
jgi:flagellar basal body-associated protein FliL